MAQSTQTIRPPRHPLSLTLVMLLSAAVTLSAQQAATLRLKTITFDDVKFDIKKGQAFKRNMLPETIEQLDGALIKVRGYILPSFKQEGITQFILVRDNKECCFGPKAALFDCMVVQMDAGKSIAYTVRPIAVEGIFTVREYKGPDGSHLAIYHLKSRSAG